MGRHGQWAHAEPAPHGEPARQSLELALPLYSERVTV
jgi:hypothetical protein